jgi:hypothetical protein
VFLATCSRGLPTAFFPDISPSRMFTTNSLCLTVCLIHQWRLFCKIFKTIFLLSPFERLHHWLRVGTYRIHIYGFGFSKNGFVK